MPDKSTYIVTMIEQICLFGLFIVVFIGICVKVIKNIIAKTVTVNARVLDKEYTALHTPSNYTPNGMKKYYIIVFYANGKTLKFKTSVWQYDSIQKDEVGVLKYKGDRFISFN